MEDKRAHERLDVIELEMEEHRKEHKDFEASIRENTELTKTIEANTSELVALFKGATHVRSFFIWASPIAAFGIGLYAFINWLLGRS